LGFGSEEEQEIFLFSTASVLVLGPTQGYFFRDKKALSAKVKNGGAIPSLPHTSS
jgi:hypothetical protein